MKQEQPTELSTLNPIRVETALSRFPVHRLARKGSIDIDIRETEGNGVTFRWEVDYSKKHGQPGPLAYKIDTLIVNRRIEEAKRPIPRIIRLGSLRDICRELGISEGENVTTIRKALRQNAFAGITAKTTYKLGDGTVQTLEADFTRYSVVFTGEKLPDGRKADAVYIVLNDVFMRVINGAMTRPLDYDYLKSLPPAPQRFYELLSYQMYAALKFDRPRAKLVYSEFCSHAPQKRHLDWERVRSQMNKVHRPHRNSGYIAEVDYQRTTDGKGQPDWIMLFKPGPKARAEFRAFTKRGGPVLLEVEPFDADPLPQITISETSPVEAALTGHGISRDKASELARQHSETKILEQIAYLEFEMARKPGKIKDSAAWLYSGVTGSGHAKPKGFKSPADLAREKEAKAEAERKAAESRKLRADQKAFEADIESRIKAHWQSKSPEEQARIEMMALANATEVDRQAYHSLPHPRLKKATLRTLRDDYIRKILTEIY